MVLVDTSVWVAHLRDGNTGLESLLNEGHVICHSFVVGELACGNLKNRCEILSLLRALPMAAMAQHEEVIVFIEKNELMGKGLGFIDIHLVASAILSKVSLWTRDKKLDQISSLLGLSYQPRRSRHHALAGKSQKIEEEDVWSSEPCQRKIKQRP